MAYFVVGYDLITKQGESRNYEPIESALEDLDACHTQDSVWYVDYNGTGTQLYQHLSPELEDRDRLMVVEFNKKPSWRKGFPGTKAWIEERFG